MSQTARIPGLVGRKTGVQWKPQQKAQQQPQANSVQDWFPSDEDSFYYDLRQPATSNKSTPRSSLGGRPLFYPKIALYAQQQQAQAAALDFHDDEFFNEESSDEEAELLPEQPSGSFSGEMDLVNSKSSSSLDKDAFENQEDKENTSFDTSISEILPARAPRKSSMLPKGTPLKTLYERPAAEDDQEQIPEQFQNDDDFMLNMDDGYPVDEEVNDEPPADTRRQSLVARRVSFHQSTKMGSDDLEEPSIIMSEPENMNSTFATHSDQPEPAEVTSDPENTPAKMPTKVPVKNVRTHQRPPKMSSGSKKGLDRILDVNAGTQEVSTDDGQVVRRSTRRRYEPLEYWRNERVVYGRRKSGYFPVPVIHDIIRVPQSEAEKARQKKKAHKLSKVTAKIMDPKSEQIVEKDVFTPALEGANFKDVEGADFKLAKILNNPASTGGCSGMILLPKNTEKPASTSDVTIFGYVVAGEIEVTINKTVAVLGRGCSFVIPKGNQYKYNNKFPREARVFFVNQQ